jgi:hypothetical protein
MFDIKTIVTSLVVSIVVVLGAGLVSDNQAGGELGAITRMPNVDFVTKSLTASTTSTTATSTISAMTRSATQGGVLILKDSDGSGCSSLAMNGGATVLGTITCP